VTTFGHHHSGSGADVNPPLLSITRRTRFTPFTSRVEAAGVRSNTVYNHMLLPTSFRGLEGVYHRLRSAVKFFRFAQMAAYLGSGKNSLVFTIVTFRARSIAATRGCETPRRSARHRKGPDPGFGGSS
jgi:hypothetical protein